ncbi:MAG TPA: NAD(P)-dependent oxidoreductase [Ktedonobacteraceae bacterium]|nr:NAD(P)-dependent oxidoreductase [Ktedonobacteraceae bacterium]
MKETIGFLGLGRMGQPMVENLLKAGYRLKVYNRTASKMEPFMGRGVEAASHPGAALVTGGIVVSMVSDDAALEEIVRSAGFLEHLGPGGIHLSMSTVAPTTSQNLAQLHARSGSHYVDAPVFGAPQVAAAQQLWICLAGPQAAKERVRPVLEALSQGIFDFGETVGAANLVKLGGNFISFAAVQALREVLSLAQKSAIDPINIVEMFTQTLYPIAVYQHFGKQLALDPNRVSRSWIAVKDVGLFEEMARQQQSQAPLADLLHRLLGSYASSHGEIDTPIRKAGS